MQVQLPDELYKQLRAVADEKEWSLAETLRRASEILISVYPRAGKAHQPWKLPEPVDLGRALIPENQWAEMMELDRLKHILGDDKL
jgi:hypothetical protein